MPGLLQPEREVIWIDDVVHMLRVKSLLSGKWNNLPGDDEVTITRAQWDAWQGGQHIQSALPHLTADQREFLLTGATPAEWDAAFPEED